MYIFLNSYIFNRSLNLHFKIFIKYILFNLIKNFFNKYYNNKYNTYEIINYNFKNIRIKYKNFYNIIKYYKLFIPIKFNNKFIIKYYLFFLPYMYKNNIIFFNYLKRFFINKLSKLNGIFFKKYIKKFKYIYVINIFLTYNIKFSVELDYNNNFWIYLHNNYKISYIFFLYFLGISNKYIFIYSKFSSNYFLKYILLKHKLFLFNFKYLFIFNKYLEYILYLIKQILFIEFYNKYKFIYKKNNYNLKNTNIIDLYKKYNYKKINKNLILKNFIYILDILIDFKYKFLFKNENENFNNLYIETFGDILKYIFIISLERFNIYYNKNKFLFKSLINIIYEYLIINPLCQLYNQLNPVIENTQINKVSFIGPGALSKENNQNKNLTIRDIKTSQLGKLCILYTSENLKGGLILNLTNYSNINIKNKIKYPLLYYNKYNKYPYIKQINNINKNICKYKLLSFRQNNIFNSFKSLSLFNNKFYINDNNNVTNNLFLNLYTFLSTSFLNIPFITLNDPIRSLMATRMISQALPNIYTEKPYLNLNILFPNIFNNLYSLNEGIIIYVSKYIIKIRDIFNRVILYYLNKSNLLINKLKPIIWVGEYIKKGDLLANSNSFLNNLLTLGKNITITYNHLNGYDFEDAFIINKNLILNYIFSSLHIYLFNTNLKFSYKYYEYLIKKIPKKNKNFVINLNNNGVINKNTYINNNDIILGKIMIIPFFFIKNKHILYLLKQIFGINLKIIIDKSYKLNLNIKGRVIKILYNISNLKLLNNYIYFLIKIYIGDIKLLNLGDKLCSRYGNKGTISFIANNIDLPFNSTLNIVPDILLNPLSIPSRTNLGQLFEGLINLSSFFNDKIWFMNSFYDIYYSINYIKYIIYNELIYISINKNNNLFLTPYLLGYILFKQSNFGFNLCNFILSMILYFFKLIHITVDKFQVRSQGKYYEISQQPIKGRQYTGGQRFGEMEIWALETFGSVYNIKELLNLKSDNIKTRNIILNYFFTKSKIQKINFNETLKILIRELNSITIDLKIINFNFKYKNIFNNYNLFNTKND